MSTTNLDHLRYPIGHFEAPEQINAQHVETWIRDIASFPQQVRQLTEQLSDAELTQTYRPGSWNIRQVVHHCADSHVNAIIRFKLALTEDQPTIRPYFEALWGELPDSIKMPLSITLNLLDGLHARLAYLLDTLSEDQWQRQFFHPEHGRAFRIDENIGVYSWHGRHHLGHIRLALGIPVH